MGLIGNHSVLNKSHARFTNGTATAGAFAANNRSNFKNISVLRSRDIYWPAIISYPAGYTPGSAMVMARSSGGLASHTQLNATLSTTDALSALGINIDANLSATLSTTDAVLALIVALEASLSASGTITDAQLAIILLLEAALSGSGTFTDAQLGNILNLAASLSGSMTVSNSITNLVNLSADIGGAPELSPQGLSEELLDNQDIETGVSLRESLRLVLSAVAGKLSGAPGTSITIRNVVDDKDRIVATVDASGNRTSITYDVSDS